MKKTDSLGQNEPIDNREYLPSSSGEPAASEHPRNPLIPPAHGSSQWEGWWRRVGEGKADSDSASQVFSVAGDLSTISARVTASLVPILLVVLIAVLLLKDYWVPADPANSDSPVAAGFLAEAPVGAERDALDPGPVKLAALPAPQISEPQVKAEDAVKIEEEAAVQDTAAVEIEPTLNVEPEVISETESISEAASISEEVTVEGILYSRSNPSAIVGGKIVHVGDIVSDARIVGITKDRVVFERLGQRWGCRVQEAVAAP
jgi:hypothetical protein